MKDNKENKSKPSSEGGKPKRLSPKQTTNLPLLLTYQEAAFYCGCSKSQIQRGIKDGDIAVGRTPGGIGNRSKRVLSSSILKWATKYA
jgi:excisionase family DNA binding protein